jgi:glutathione S-transferase
METQLQKTPFIVGDNYTVADIALYAYTHEAHRGGFDMQKYPAVGAWLQRVASDKGHVPIEWLP